MIEVFCGSLCGPGRFGEHLQMHHCRAWPPAAHAPWLQAACSTQVAGWEESACSYSAEDIRGGFAAVRCCRCISLAMPWPALYICMWGMPVWSRPANAVCCVSGPSWDKGMMSVVVGLGGDCFTRAGRGAAWGRRPVQVLLTTPVLNGLPAWWCFRHVRCSWQRPQPCRQQATACCAVCDIRRWQLTAAPAVALQCCVTSGPSRLIELLVPTDLS